MNRATRNRRTLGHARRWTVASVVLASVPLLGALSGGCAKPGRPAAMADADVVRHAPQAVEAAKRAPEAATHADKLRAEAERAQAAGDRAGAQILSERALAAYEHAAVLARVAVANERVARAKIAFEDSEKNAKETDAEQRRVATETEDLEVRLKAQKDAEALTAAGPGKTSATRDRARLAVARSLAMDARMLCGAAQMLGAKPESIAEARKLADEVTSKLATDPRPVPLDQAARARAACLSALTVVRRSNNASSSLGRADELLAQLSAMGGLAPSRDERGVVVALRDSFERGSLRTEARQSVSTLARVAQAHPEFPVQVVVHAATAGPRDEQEISREKAQAEVVTKSLVEGGVAPTRIHSDVAAGSQPHLLQSPGDLQRNQRIEITFVDPGG